MCDFGRFGMGVFFLKLGSSSMGMMGTAGLGVQGHFNPAFMQGGSTGTGFNPPDGPRKRFRGEDGGH